MKEKQTINPELGKRLKKLISSHNLTQQDFAKIVDYTPEYISEVVRGKKNVSKALATRATEKVFNDIRPEWLMGLNEYPSARSEGRANYKSHLAQISAFETLAYSAGYTFKNSGLETHSWVTSDRKNHEITLSTNTTIHKDGMIVLEVENAELNELVSMVRDYTAFLLERTIKKKTEDQESTDNG